MSDLKTTTRQEYSTPGQILDEEFLQPLNISQYQLAKAMGVGQIAVSEIIRGKRAISVAMAYKLGKALNTSAEFWMNLQRDYDMFTFDVNSISNVQTLVDA